MNKLINFLMIIMAFLIYFVSINAFELSPIGFDKRIDNGDGYAEFYLDNSTEEIQIYKIKVLSSGKKNDISKYVKIYPAIISVKPQERGVVKVYAQSPSNAKEGAYRFMLGFESISVPTLEKYKKNIESSVSMRVNVNVEMEAYIGELQDKIDVLEKKIYHKDGKKYFSGEFINNSQRGYEIGIGFVDADNSLIEVHSQGRMAKKGKLNINLEIPPRAYKLIFYDYNNQLFLKSSLVL